MYCKCLSAPSGLFLVLSLCSSEEIIQDTPQVLEGRPVFWVFIPAQTHDIKKPIRTVFWLWHPVAPLQVLDHLWVGHTWKKEKTLNMMFSAIINHTTLIMWWHYEIILWWAGTLSTALIVWYDDKQMSNYQGKVCVHMSLFPSGGSQMTTHQTLWKRCHS